MKPRKAGAFEDALLELIGVLGIEKCAEVVDKSTSLVRKWSDPDNRTLPSLEQALVLDLEFARKERCMPPLLHAYTNIIEREFEAYEDGEHVLAALLSLQFSVCELGKRITSDLIRPEQVTAEHQDHWQKMLEQINLIIRETRNLEISINSWKRNLDQVKPQKMSGSL